MRSSAGSRPLDDLEAALIDASLDAQIDMVLSQVGPDVYRATASTGSVRFRRSIETETEHDGAPVDRYRYEVEHVDGTDPLSDTSIDRFVGLTDELAGRFPERSDNAYPHAHDQIAQFFDSVHAPDLVAQHTAGHHFGSNLGEHGSLGVVQSRAPFIVSGAGVTPRGTIAQSARMIDVAPTLLRLLGAAPHPASIGPTGAPRASGLLLRQDGDPLTGIVDHGAADHVVVVLLDGCNANVLYDAIGGGDAPAIASLAASGTSLGHGLLASLPTATLANHTTASTGAHPGHSGVLHNMWHDRTRRVTPDLLAMDQMFDAMVHLRADVETVHQAVHRNRPDAFTAALFEFCDTGADVSSFADFRAGRAPALPAADTLDGATKEFVGASGAYSFISSVDELATRQAVDLWNRTEGNPLPDFTFLALSLTDEAGHEGGPHSEMARAAIVDSDRRVARLLDAIDRSGVRERVAVVVMADHGMEVNDPSNDLAWADVRERVASDGDGLADVADGWFYLATSTDL